VTQETRRVTVGDRPATTGMAGMDRDLVAHRRSPAGASGGGEPRTPEVSCGLPGGVLGRLDSERKATSTDVGQAYGKLRLHWSTRCTKAGLGPPALTGRESPTSRTSANLAVCHAWIMHPSDQLRFLDICRRGLCGPTVDVGTWGPAVAFRHLTMADRRQSLTVRCLPRSES